jgi:hypothetical protein
MKDCVTDTTFVSITHIVHYVAFMFKQGYSPSTVKAYLSGISYDIKSNGLEDVTQSFIIQKMMRGMFTSDIFII